MKTPQLPFAKLSTVLGLPNEIWLKREDKHFYGSHKGRSIPLMVTTHAKAGAKKFVISSSGNAAIAATLAVQTHNKSKPNEPLSLHIFIGPNIHPAKLKSLQEKIAGDNTITLEQTANAKQAAIAYQKTNDAIYLRQSTDDTALLGYIELAKELAKIENLQAVFVPTSSGTTALGLHLGFKEANCNPQIHIVQTTGCHPIADAIQPRAVADEPSIAGAIVDKVALRKPAVIEAIKESQGKAWIATNEEISAAQKLCIDTTDITISTNSALALAGLQLAIASGTKWNGPIVLLITGP